MRKLTNDVLRRIDQERRERVEQDRRTAEEAVFAAIDERYLKRRRRGRALSRLKNQPGTNFGLYRLDQWGQS